MSLPHFSLQPEHLGGEGGGTVLGREVGVCRQVSVAHA